MPSIRIVCSRKQALKCRQLTRWCDESIVARAWGSALVRFGGAEHVSDSQFETAPMPWRDGGEPIVTRLGELGSAEPEDSAST